MRRLLLLLATLATAAAHAQFTQQTSNSTASLRGIANVGGALGKEIAWASGTGGTVLRTVDGGSTWTHCATPPDAEKLDFRGIQAFDAKTAVVMSSGKGDLSRIYRTVDGCGTWKLVFTNPDAPDGFFDAMQTLNTAGRPHDVPMGAIVGDPVHGKFPMFVTTDAGEHWGKQTLLPDDTTTREALFAASNQALLLTMAMERLFVTGGDAGSHIIEYTENGSELYPCGVSRSSRECVLPVTWTRQALPLSRGETAGAFAVAKTPESFHAQVIVGGDYAKPETSEGTATYRDHSRWKAAATPPHGYRSTVAYDTAHNAWITTGPNGTDISTDDGRNWRPLSPNVAKGDLPDADKNWNALSLPFVVGSKGRIGRLRPDALPLRARTGR